MEWGMKNRLSRLIQADGKALFLPIDHGYFQGPTRKLEKPGETIKPLLAYADAIMLTRGVLRNCVDPALEKPVILRVSGEQHPSKKLSGLTQAPSPCPSS